MRIKYPNPDQIHEVPIKANTTGQVIQFFDSFILICNDETNKIHQVSYSSTLEKINEPTT